MSHDAAFMIRDQENIFNPSSDIRPRGVLRKLAGGGNSKSIFGISIVHLYFDLLFFF